MKKAYLFLILLFLVSCKTTVKTVKDNVSTQVETQVEKSSDQSVGTKLTDKSTLAEETKILKALEEAENSTEEKNIHLIIYDTDKPVDEKTGKPPAKSELFITNKKATEATAKATEQVATTTNANNYIKLSQESTFGFKLDSLTNTNEKSKVTTTDKSATNTALILFVLIGVTFILFVLGKLPLFSHTGIVAKIKKLISVFMP